MADHPDSAHFPACPFAGRLRASCGDRFCRDPEKPKQVVRLADCLACPLAGSVSPAPPRRPRVGDVFAELLAAKYGAAVTSKCDCGDKIAQMNNWGPAGCRENLETIVGWIIESAAIADSEAAEDPETKGGGAGRALRAIAPDAAKRWKLRPLVGKAIRIVEEWNPEAISAA